MNDDDDDNNDNSNNAIERENLHQVKGEHATVQEIHSIYYFVG